MPSNLLIHGFYTNYTNGKAVDYVRISQRGEAADRIVAHHRVKDLTPSAKTNPESMSGRAMLARWEVIGPAYEAWKAGTEIPDDGTPLGAWSHITPAMAEHLKRMHILTVEHVRDMSDEEAARLPFPDSRKLPKLAADFLSGKDKADMARENEELKERMAALEEFLEAKMAEEPKKRGPGRPPKQKEEADAVQ